MTIKQSIDVVAQSDTEKIAVEIELQNNIDHIKENILKCVNSSEGFDKIIVAVYDSKMMKRVQTIPASNPEIEKWLIAEKLEFRYLNEFLH